MRGAGRRGLPLSHPTHCSRPVFRACPPSSGLAGGRKHFGNSLLLALSSLPLAFLSFSVTWSPFKTPDWVSVLLPTPRRFPRTTLSNPLPEHVRGCRPCRPVRWTGPLLPGGEVSDDVSRRIGVTSGGQPPPKIIKHLRDLFPYEEWASGEHES